MVNRPFFGPPKPKGAGVPRRLDTLGSAAEIAGRKHAGEYTIEVDDLRIELY